MHEVLTTNAAASCKLASLRALDHLDPPTQHRVPCLPAFTKVSWLIVSHKVCSAFRHKVMYRIVFLPMDEFRDFRQTKRLLVELPRVEFDSRVLFVVIKDDSSCVDSFFVGMRCLTRLIEDRLLRNLLLDRLCVIYDYPCFGMELREESVLPALQDI